MSRGNGCSSGKKKTFPDNKPTSETSLSIDKLPDYKIDNQHIKSFLESISIEFLFSEFGENRVNAGGSEFNLGNRLEPSLSTIRHYFQMQNSRFILILIWRSKELILKK
jgi:hypothetical protein